MDLGAGEPILTASAEDLRDFLDEGLSLYDHAARSSETIFDADLAEARVRLRIAGQALVQPVLSPLLHRGVSTSGSPELTIFIFDKTSTGLEPGVVEILEQHSASASATTTWTRASLHLLYRRQPIPSLLVLDRSRNIALLWLKGDSDLARWDCRRSVLQLLHWWLADREWQPVHAAAVCGSKGGVLIAGKGGAGKSTTALACLRAGWRYAGDDFVLISTTPQPRVENLFGTARLCSDMLTRFPELEGTVTSLERTETQEKANLQLSKKYASSSFAGFPIRAIVLPRHDGSGDYTVRRAPRPQAMLILAQTTMMTLQSELPTAFRQIAAFIAATPAYWCDVGSDLDRIPAAIEGILDGELS